MPRDGWSVPGAADSARRAAGSPRMLPRVTGFTPDSVAALAPDASALAAGRKLASPSPWGGLGRDGAALWGECKGSAVYQVRVDLSDLATKCSCPSRKFPCKHALGLLLLAAASPANVPEGTAPQWVTEWLGKRAAAAEKKESRAAEPAKPVDEAAQAKRAAKREERVAAGLDALDVWMEDLVRNGLAGLEAEGTRPFEAQAARLVDAQAPALAARVAALGGLPGAGEGWPARLLGELGKAALLVHAYRRRDELETGLRSDVLARIGFATEVDAVRRSGEQVTDRWRVCGVLIDQSDRVRVQRAWLRGGRTGRWALVLSFAAGPASFDESFAQDTAFDATLAFWPSAYPLRAVIASERSGTTPCADAPAGAERVAAVLAEAAAALARLPWIERLPVVLRDVRLADAQADRIVDGAGDSLPIVGREPRPLLAETGGRPFSVAGEWDGAALRVLAVHPAAEPMP